MIPLRVAFLPLTDCAVLAAAKERGFAEAHGIELTLVRDVSWATVRDHLVYRQVECAHLLAPLAVAVSLGLSQHRAAIAAPFKLNVNGNAITFSRGLASAIGGEAAERVLNPAETARRFASGLAALPRKPVIAVVHRFSSHALALRYWLAFAGLDPDRDVELRVLPPSFMPDALVSGEVDGFTAGEPWNSNAIAAGAGEIVALGSRIWQSGPEKVLAMREDWAEANPDIVHRLLHALDGAAAWCDAPDNHQELAQILARDCYVGRPAELIRMALGGRIPLAPGSEPFHEPNFLLMHRHAANFPWRSQALWIYSQLVRWGFVQASQAAEEAASRVFRSDIYRKVFAGAQTPLPPASLKVEGSLAAELAVNSGLGRLTLAPDRFFDGRIFDPAAIGEYLAQQRAHSA